MRSFLLYVLSYLYLHTRYAVYIVTYILCISCYRSYSSPYKVKFKFFPSAIELDDICLVPSMDQTKMKKNEKPMIMMGFGSQFPGQCDKNFEILHHARCKSIHTQQRHHFRALKLLNVNAKFRHTFSFLILIQTKYLCVSVCADQLFVHVLWKLGAYQLKKKCCIFVWNDLKAWNIYVFIVFVIFCARICACNVYCIIFLFDQIMQNATH